MAMMEKTAIFIIQASLLFLFLLGRELQIQQTKSCGHRK